ncbi:MAG: SRPBCC domain-containing protein [Lewinellaceae bacterium]|nr:SRPBCC domain-containing protein [Lewinellaceae bacterium]HPG07938.1 SRPBCC domain-containing protein [Saprospiraceae bacterium]
MAGIYHNFPIHAFINSVFETITTPKGLDLWWTKSSAGKSGAGELFQFDFGPDYQWTAILSEYIPHEAVEWTLQEADQDWAGTKVGFHLKQNNQVTDVQFYHVGWKSENEHFRISNYCWAMYLRILKRYLEFDEYVPYEERLNA